MTRNLPSVRSMYLVPLLFVALASGGVSPAHAFPCYFQSDHVHQGTALRIHRIDSCSPPGQPGRALVIFSPGDGYQYTQYADFMEDLASTSAVVVSVAQGNLLSNAERSERMLKAIDFVSNLWVHKHLLGEKIAFIGHSRGGEAIMMAARDYQGQTGNRASAVISLMATDVAKGGGEAEYLTGSASRSYLSLVAGRDGDVLGYCMPQVEGCGEVVRNGLTMFDRVGFETGPWNADYQIEKSAKLLPGFSHGGWTGPEIPNQFNPVVSVEIQRAVVHEYVLRFLDWQVFGNNEQRYYFSGVMESDLIDGVVSQYSKHSGPVYTIDSFADGVLSSSDKGAGLVTVSGPAEFVEGAVHVHDETAAHDSGSLAVYWRRKTSSSIHWKFPKDVFPDVPTIDASAYGNLSLRATRIYGSSLNDGSEVRIRLRLSDVKGKFADVLIGDGTPFAIPEPGKENGILTAYFKATSTVTNSMATLRIPLALFEGVDLATIRSVSIIFGEDSSRGALILDSIELTH